MLHGREQKNVEMTTNTKLWADERLTNLDPEKGPHLANYTQWDGAETAAGMGFSGQNTGQYVQQANRPNGKPWWRVPHMVPFGIMVHEAFPPFPTKKI